MRRQARQEPDSATDRGRARALLDVSRETEARLALYVERLHRWQTIKNLVGPATQAEVWTRHIADSAQVLRLAPDAKGWADLGSGAGFPGLVVAILLAGQPGAVVHLIESNHRKCAFLREVARDTQAPAIVHAGRIEDVLPRLGPLDAVTARALAPLDQLLVWTRPLIAQGTLALFLKGDEIERESANIPPDIGEVLTLIPSTTHPTARIAMIRGAARPRQAELSEVCHADVR